MALSKPIVGLMEDLKRENATLEELRQIYQLLDKGEILEGFRFEQGLLLFQGRYFVGK